MIIGIDFDGTCVAHEFPKVGKNIGAAEVLSDLVANGHKLILWTVRSDDKDKKYLTDAINWFEENEIPLYAVNKNPGQFRWSKSPKAHCDLYIDDAALGCPLVFPDEGRPYVDWIKVSEMLVQRNILKELTFS